MARYISNNPTRRIKIQRASGAQVRRPWIPKIPKRIPKRSGKFKVDTARQNNQKKFSLKAGDHDTPLTKNGERQAKETGAKMKKFLELPDVIFVSPYQRTLNTLGNIIKGWPELDRVPTFEDDRIREQEHGIANLYNDWRVFHALCPDQKELFDRMGQYWYCYPQGESVPDVRERVRSMMSTLIREYSERRVLMITHHLTIISIRAQLERLDANDFIRIDKHDKPINCGVTIYKGDPRGGKNGRLKLSSYNKKIY